jgi:trimethylguanosine synthase
MSLNIADEERKIASRMAAAAPSNATVLLDPFCGVGGNTIAFALSGRWKRVYAIEKDPATLLCAKHNAEIYGVADQITWFEGDCFDILGLHEEKTDNELWQLRVLIETQGVVFASPPWGGEFSHS